MHTKSNRSLSLGRALLLLIGLSLSSAWAATPDAEARQAWQLLDYIAVDYAGAVRDGQVVEAGEYAEMQEFAALAQSKLQALPAKPQRAQLLDLAAQLVDAVNRRVEAALVADTAHKLADQLIFVYQIPAMPAVAPDVSAAAPLYAQQCAACHGAQGGGDGVAAVGLSPPPIDFTDAQRAAQRSPLALYQVISQGLAGTAMADYGHLAESERWALAFYVGGLAYKDAQLAQGQALWRSDPRWRDAITDLEALSRTSTADLAEVAGVAQARAVIAYLRAEPAAVTHALAAGTKFSLARQRLNDSVQAYRDGHVAPAKVAALSAYLDGVEPYEAALATADRKLMREIEVAMSALRSKLGDAASLDEIQPQAALIGELLNRAEGVLMGSQSDATAAFLGSLTVLLREGLEALLIVIGIIAFLRKAERRDVLPYVHAGWLGALFAGGLTWVVATHVVSISGASRELTEGFSALFAAAVLLSVGIWMHQKSMAGRWQEYLQAKVSAALTRRSALFLFSLAFIAVYREVFETILFLIAMWSEHNASAVVAGVLLGTAVLAAVAFWMLRLSKRLPIGQFFSISSILIAVLAVILVGKGVAALQEAGWIDQALLTGPRIEWLGVYPSLQSLFAQLAVLVIAVAAYWINAKASRSIAGSTAGGPKS